MEILQSLDLVYKLGIIATIAFVLFYVSAGILTDIFTDIFGNRFVVKVYLPVLGFIHLFIYCAWLTCAGKFILELF